MTASDLLIDGFERLRDAVYPAVTGLSLEELAFRPDGQSNSIAWLVWHLTRVEDQDVARLAATEPVWTEAGWDDRFALGFDPKDTGRGHGPDEVAVVVADARSLLDSFEEVHERTVGWVRSLGDAELDRALVGVPPVTMGTRIVGALVDCLQHAGQAAFLRGLVQRRVDHPGIGR